MLQKTNLLLMIIVALVVYIATREMTLRELGERGNNRDVSSAKVARSPREKQGGDSPDPYEKEQVKNTLTKSAKSFQECYLKYLDTKPTNPNVSAKLDWQIQEDGSTSDQAVVTTDVESLSTCLIDKLRDVRFPPPPEGRPFYVVHNFQFKTTEQLAKEKKEREEMEKKYQPIKK